MGDLRSSRRRGQETRAEHGWSRRRGRETRAEHGSRPAVTQRDTGPGSRVLGAWKPTSITLRPSRCQSPSPGGTPFGSHWGGLGGVRQRSPRSKACLKRLVVTALMRSGNGRETQISAERPDESGHDGPSPTRSHPAQNGSPDRNPLACAASLARRHGHPRGPWRDGVARAVRQSPGPAHPSPGLGLGGRTGAPRCGTTVGAGTSRVTRPRRGSLKRPSKRVRH